MKDELEKLDTAIETSRRLAQSDDANEWAHYTMVANWLTELRDLKFRALGPEDENLVSLDEHRIRQEGEFQDESMLYVEALWGRQTFGFNVAIRDLERMRRGTEEEGKPLRPPETFHEAVQAIKHVRALANDMARHWDIEDYVRKEDDEAVGKK